MKPEKPLPNDDDDFSPEAIEAAADKTPTEVIVKQFIENPGAGPDGA